MAFSKLSNNLDKKNVLRPRYLNTGDNNLFSKCKHTFVLFVYYSLYSCRYTTSQLLNYNSGVW